jgi:sulfite reductase (ferredoxin)
VAGASLDTNGNTQLAEKIDEISAHDLPVLAEEVLRHYSERKSSYPGFLAYLNAEGRDTIRKSCDKFRGIPSFDIDRSYYRDWGDTEIFSLAGKGTGECSAGLFDLIEIDLARLRQIRSAVLDQGADHSPLENLYALALVSARMLLIIRGVEAASDAEVFVRFAALFIDENLVDSRFLHVAEKGRLGDATELIAAREDVIGLADAVESLYLGMDNSLQFKTSTVDTSATSQPKKHRAPDLVKDLRGVSCPMNFVKTKMALSQLSKGQILEITLDDGAPIDNVPRSVEQEKHQIVEQKKQGNHWVVIIKKGS